MMSKVKNTLITPYHPYLDEHGMWVTGKDTVGDFEWTDSVLNLYNLVLVSGHIIDAGGVLACTLAHGFKGPVIEHPFFGTEAVVECLSKAKGWVRKMPYFIDLEVVRENGLIVDWVEGKGPEIPALPRGMTGV